MEERQIAESGPNHTKPYLSVDHDTSIRASEHLWPTHASLHPFESATQKVHIHLYQRSVLLGLRLRRECELLRVGDNGIMIGIEEREDDADAVFVWSRFHFGKYDPG